MEVKVEDKLESNETSNKEQKNTKYNGPMPVVEDAHSNTISRIADALDKKPARQMNEEAESKRRVRLAKRTQDKRSEEFSGNAIMRSVNATENGTAIRKLFTMGELIEKGEENRYSNEEKDFTRKKMELMAARISELSLQKISVQKDIKVADTQIEETLLNTDKNETTPLKPQKKKLWER